MIGVVISGTGDVSNKHYKAITSTTHGKLLGVCSRDAKRAEEAAKKWHTKAYGFDEMLKDPEVDLVVICSSDDEHYRQSIKALEAGKNVIVEKPPALNLRELVHMVKLSKDKKVQLFPVHNYIFRPRILQVKQMLDKGEIGEVTYAFFSLIQRMPEERAKRYHGAFLTQAYHQIYLSNFLLGLPEEITAMSSIITYKEVKMEELAVSMFKYKNGAVANIVINWCLNDLSTHSWLWLEKILGTKGVITVSALDDYSYHEDIPYLAAIVLGYPYSFINYQKHVIDDVLAEKKKPLISAYDAVIVLDMIDKLKNCANKGKVIKYKPPSLEELIKQYKLG
ncbi:MAG: Gfo/Idh/MocA family oxidoreductase [Nitrososphaerales archaeon]